jgi:hypothetical protein
MDAKYTLYVPYDSTKNAVWICPGATTMAEITETCANGKAYKDGDSGVSIVTIDNVKYWSVPDMTGTGGMNTQVLAAATSNPAPATPATLANTGISDSRSYLYGMGIIAAIALASAKYRSMTKYSDRN